MGMGIVLPHCIGSFPISKIAWREAPSVMTGWWSRNQGKQDRVSGKYDMNSEGAYAQLWKRVEKYKYAAMKSFKVMLHDTKFVYRTNTNNRS